MLLLKEADGTEYRAHFHYIHHDAPIQLRRHKHYAHETHCLIHRGACVVEEVGEKKICRAQPERVGVARCSVLDVFTKVVGRKYAFSRAVQDWPRAIRIKLWATYLDKCGVPKPHANSRNGWEV